MAAPSIARTHRDPWFSLRPPWRRGSWTPEEVSRAFHVRRDELRRELNRIGGTGSIPARALDEIVDDAICAVVMKPRPIHDEEHLRRAFWVSVRLLVARYHEGRHRVKVGARERIDFETAVRSVSTPDSPAIDDIDLKERMARAADYMAQLTQLEASVVAVMAIRGIGIKLAAHELELPVARVKAAARSADMKLDQVAVIATAGRMCDYRKNAIAAHITGTATGEEMRAARAHIAACLHCRRAYTATVRDMRRRDFRRRASAAFLPPLPHLITGHSGWLLRLWAHSGGRVFGSSYPFGSARERALTALGSGVGAAKTAGVVTGAVLVVASATVSIDHDLHRPTRRATSQRSHLTPNYLMHTTATTATIRQPTPHESPNSADHTQSSGGFQYLGGDVQPHTPAQSRRLAKPGTAVSLAYLGGNTAPAKGAVSSDVQRGAQSDNGGQFSP
jgi:hypothetical protein